MHHGWRHFRRLYWGQYLTDILLILLKHVKFWYRISRLKVYEILVVGFVGMHSVDLDRRRREHWICLPGKTLGEGAIQEEGRTLKV